MNRMWEIREQNDRQHFGMKSAEEQAYECGFEEGYKQAIEELKHHYEKHFGLKRY